MRADERVHVTLSPIATPLPLTFVGLLAASTILTGLELGWIPAAQSQEAGWALIAVPFPLQLVAAYFGFHGRSATAATGSSALAAAWIGIALELITAPPGAPSPSRSTAMLVFAIGAALLVPAVADAHEGNALPAIALGLASTRFLLTGITGLTHAGGLKEASGIVGCVVAAVALYAALALELEGSSGDPVLPTLRRPRARSALVEPLDEQVAEVENEAGVRKKL